MPSATEVKVCGITRLEDARLAVELGAWAVGLNFFDGSPRVCDIGVAEEIGVELKRQTEVAGVFVNATLDDVARTADRCELTLLQLHGDEGPAFAQEAARRTGCKVMKATRVRGAQSLAALRPYVVDYHLLDAYRPGVPGGTGETFDWEFAARHDRNVPLVLAGGLTPDNVAAAIRATEPFAVDTASGTESEPGRKDPELMRGFFEAVERAPASAAAGG